METTFHPSLTLVPSLVNCSLYLCTLSLTESPPFTHPILPFQQHNVEQEGGSIKCSGKYIEIYFSFKIKFPIIRLPEHLNSTISIFDPDGRMCMSIKQAEVKEGTETHTVQTHHWGLMLELIPQEEYCKLSSHVSESGRSDRTSGIRTGDCTNQD